jgi:hypothetical protein
LVSLFQIAENQAGAVVATLDSKKLSLTIDTHALILRQNIDGKQYTFAGADWGFLRIRRKVSLDPVKNCCLLKILPCREQCCDD